MYIETFDNTNDVDGWFISILQQAQMNEIISFLYTWVYIIS